MRRTHGGRPRSTDGESSDEESVERYDAAPQSARSVRHSSASTVPSQDLTMHFNKRPPPHHIHPHHQQHLGVNRGVHHPQAVYLSPNPSSGGPGAPPMYYPAPTQNGGYPHTPNSMAHRELDEDYDSASGTDGINDVNPYHRMQMQQPKYHPQYHPHGPSAPYAHAGADPAQYYSPNLPTPAVSPASSCSGPNLPPPPQYQQQNGSQHHSPPPGSSSGGAHQPTAYQAGQSSNPQHPQPIHYAAYNNHRLYMANEVDQGNQSYVPRMHQSQHTYPSSQNMPVSAEGTHGLGISMNGPSMKVEVSTPIATGQAW